MRQDRTNPFPGLRPFDIDENELFFGRSHQIDQLLARLRQSRFTAVVGTSGSGKSSLVRAGLLPALKRGLMAAAGSRWRIALFRPINDPIGNLTRALLREEVFADSTANEDEQLSFIDTAVRRSSLGLVELVRDSQMQPGENLLIVVDQFEELFRFEETFICENPADEATAFVKLLLAATVQQREVPIYVVLTMRSDYLGESARFRGLPEAINEGQYLVPRMTDDERRQAITAPVAVGKGHISEPLVNRLLNDAGDDPGKLPLLQHALMRTWEHWENDGRIGGAPLGISNYESIGSLAGSLTKHANDVLNQLSAAQKLVAERIFKALTAKGPDGRGLRTPRTFGELCDIAATDGSSADVRAVIEAYRREGRSFLMPPPYRAENPDEKLPLLPDTLIDISHESLILGWDKLQQWVEDEANSARMYKRLAECAVQYDTGVDELLVPPKLPVFLEWRETQHPNQAWARRYFNPEWTSQFREGGSTSSEYDTEFDRAVAFLNDSDVAAQKQVEIDRKAAAARLRRLAFTTVAFAVLSLVATIGAFAALTQSKKAKENLATANNLRAITEEQKRQLEVAQKQLKVQLAQTEEQRENAVREQEKAEQQRKIARAAEATAVVAKREAEEQRDVANKAAKIAREKTAEAVKEKKNADIAKDAAVASEARAAEQAALAETSRREAVEKGEEARLALIEGDKQRDRAEKEFWESDSVLKTLRNIDNQTLNLRAINRQNDPINTAVFSPDKKHAFISSRDRAVLFEQRLDSSEFVASDFRDIPRLLTKLQGEKLDIKSLLLPETQKALISVDPDNPDPSSVASLVDGFNALLKEPALYALAGFSHVKLRQETQARLDQFKQDPTSVDLVQLNRLLLEDAYPMEIAQVKQFNESTVFSPPYREFAFSPDGKQIAARFYPWEIDVFDLQGQLMERRTTTSVIASIAFSPKGNSIWSRAHENESNSEINRILIWKNNAEKDNPLRLEFAEPINRAVMSPDETNIAVNSASSTAIRLWDIDKKTSIPLKGSEKLPDNDRIKSDKSDDSQGPDLVTHIAYSNDGKYIVATFKNHKNVYLWNTEGTLLHVMNSHQCQVNSAEFNHDGTQIVSAGEDGAGFIWDRESGRVKHELRGHMGLMITHPRKGVRVWLPPIPFPLKFDLKHREGEYVPLNSAKFSPDGKKVLMAGSDGRVEVWEWKKGEAFGFKTIDLKGYTGNVLNAEFSTDGNYVIAAGEDGAARIWSVSDNEKAGKESAGKRVDGKSCKEGAETKSGKSKH